MEMGEAELKTALPYSGKKAQQGLGCKDKYQ